jgi:hypothetical protein
MRRFFVALVATLSALAALVTVPAGAVSNSDVYVLHGIPGVTVDVYVNGDLTLDSFEPEDIAGPLSLPAGDYDIDIFAEAATPAATAGSRTDSAVIDVTAPVPGGESVSVIAHLDASGAPTLSAFVNDLSDTEFDEGRVTIRHTAQAPAVDIVAGGAPVAPFINISNGGEQVADLPVGDYPTGIAANGTTAVLFDAPVTASAGTNLVVYAIGDLSSSFTLITQSFDGLLPPFSDVRVIHGIPGLTVDVYLNGALFLPGFAPKTVTDTQQLVAGNYDIDIFAAVSNPPAAIGDRTDTAAIDITASVPDGADIDLVAHLNESGTAVLTPFVNDTSLIDGGINARVSIRHTAQAPAVDIVANGAPVQGLTNIVNGEAKDVELPAGNYPTGIAAKGTTAVLAPAPLNLVPGQSVTVYAIGTLGSTLDLVVRSDAGLNLGEQYRGTTNKAGFTARLYLAALGRTPDASGFAYWVDRLENERMTLQRITEFFLDSPEFRDRFAGIDTDMEYLELAYEHVFGRAPDAQGQVYWMGRLADGSVTRAELIVFFADSPEFRGYTGTN